MVMIHFDGWNQRYDEWIEMDSERLRGKGKHSARKGKTKQSVCHLDSCCFVTQQNAILRDNQSLNEGKD